MLSVNKNEGKIKCNGHALRAIDNWFDIDRTRNPTFIIWIDNELSPSIFTTIKSPTYGMFVQEFVQPYIKKLTSNLRITCPSWREYTGYPWIPIEWASNTENISMSLRCHDLNFQSPRCYSFGANLMYGTATPTWNPGPNIWPPRSGWLTGQPISSCHKM